MSLAQRSPSTFAARVAEAGVQLVSPARLGQLVVDLDRYCASVSGRPLDLSPRQVELLALFLAEPARVWSRTQLHVLCWGDATPSRRVDVQLCRLRAKTGLELFRNVRDRGWALRVDRRTDEPVDERVDERVEEAPSARAGERSLRRRDQRGAVRPISQSSLGAG